MCVYECVFGNKPLIHPLSLPQDVYIFGKVNSHDAAMIDCGDDEEEDGGDGNEDDLKCTLTLFPGGPGGPASPEGPGGP